MKWFAILTILKLLLLCVMWVRKNFFDYAYVSPENFFDPPPRFDDLVKILGNVGQSMTTPPPNVYGFATSLLAVTTGEGLS